MQAASPDDPVENRPAPEAVIWIASYPKSGNTWVQSVVRRAGRRYGFPRRDLDVYKLLEERRRPEAVEAGIRPEVSKAPTTVLKTHARHSPDGEIHPRLGLRTAGFVYVLRNPLDLLLSYINFTRLQYERNRDSAAYQQTLFSDLLGFERPVPYEQWLDTKLEDIPRANLDHALDRFGEAGTAIPGVRMAGGSWLEHALSWLEAGAALPSVTLRYEDLLKGPDEFLPLGRLFDFRDRQILKAVTAVNERQREQQYNKIFFNKMSAYYYPGFFSAAAIDRFLQRYGGELKQLGYGDLPGGA
jgi:hypothetical protein